ncbi:MAG TPA: hypothetical protein VMP08_00055, partial [Anaerolineae bacterium]|nr:hypothetical protein [Anaerolineae bacterium]
MALVNSTIHFKIRSLKFRLENSVADRFARPVLIVTALLSAIIYALLLTKPINLIEYADRPLFDLRQYTQQVDPLALPKLIGALAILGGLYWLAWRSALRCHDRRAWLIVIGGASLFALALLLMYPYDAADLFDNIMHGRIISVYGANPFQKIASDFSSDPFYRYTAWRYVVSAYGPLWESLASVVTHVSGKGVIANVLAFKLTLSAFWVGCIVLIALIMRRAAPDRALAAVVLFAWNPIVLYETIGNGHNDITLVFWMLLAAWLLIDRRYGLALIALIIGTLFKYIPVLLIPTALIIGWRDLGQWRPRVRLIIFTALIGGALVLAAFAPFWHGADTLSVDRRAHMFTTSLPAVINVALTPSLGEETAGDRIALIAAGATVLFALVQTVRAWRDRSVLSFTRSAFYILLFYLLITCLWFQQWYVVWLLGFAALLSPGLAARLGALLSYTAQTKVLI